MATFSKALGAQAKSVIGAQVAANRFSMFAVAVAFALALTAAVLYLVGFALWSEIVLRLQEIQAHVGHWR